MLRNLSLLVAVSAVALAAPAMPAYAKADKPNSGNNGNGNGNTPTPTPAPAPAPAPSSACNQTYGVVVSGAIGCAGLFDGNIFGGSKAKVDLQTTGLASLGSDLVVVQGGNTATGQVAFGDLSKTTSLQGGDTISFGKTLYGETIIGAHFGNVAGPAQNMSVLWLFDFGTTGATGIKLNNTQGFSNSVLYSSGLVGVPEPSAWALFILGFGTIGGSMRRRHAQRMAARIA